MRIRPPIRLVQPMPTELPLDTVYASEKDNSSEVRNDFVQANKPLSNLLKMPKRQLDLRESFFENEASPLTQRQISAEQMDATANVNAEMPLFDLKCKFLKK